MIAPEFLARLGAYVVKDFLDPATCASFRAASRSAVARQATVGEVGTEAVDAEIRRTRRFAVEAPHVANVRGRLLAIRPSLERHFDVSITGVENPQFLGYAAGDFYRPHRDNRASYRLAPQIKRRQVSIVVFLNRVGRGDEEYEGGELVLYGLLGDDRLASRGVPLRAEEGLLIGFRSDVLHEVMPVTYGERYSIASWFY